MLSHAVSRIFDVMSIIAAYAVDFREQRTIHPPWGWEQRFPQAYIEEVKKARAQEGEGGGEGECEEEEKGEGEEDDYTERRVPITNLFICAAELRLTANLVC